MPLTALRNVLDPLTGDQQDVRFRADSVIALDRDGPADRDIDGSAWLLLPAPYDADAHMPFVATGVRKYDLYAALWGGISHMNVALPYQLIAGHSLADLVAELTRSTLPGITPVVSVNPTDDSGGFAGWLSQHRTEVAELTAGICKLYTPDPNFDANLDAIWAAGFTPAVFAYTRPELDRLLSRAHAPLHVRHATSAGMVAAIGAVPGVTIQTSPHMLLQLAAGRREALVGLPTPPDDADRTSLLTVLDRVDVIASDHASPPLDPPTGPGLQTQQHFVASLLTLCEREKLSIADVWPKVTTRPAQVFGVQPAPGFTVVDPTWTETVQRWPRQRDDRAPYLGSELRGRTIAVSAAGRIVLV